MRWLGALSLSAALLFEASPAESQSGLPPEVIQRVVRQNFGKFRMCYENGLRNCPNL